MTVSELCAELESRDTSKDTFAGGMTAGEIEEIKAASAALRKKRADARAKAS